MQAVQALQQNALHFNSELYLFNMSKIMQDSLHNIRDNIVNIVYYFIKYLFNIILNLQRMLQY